jgi:hypothetical protein
MKIIFISFFIFISSQISAHECILQGTSAEEITIYNACKADLKKRGPSTDLNNSLLKVKIKELISENKNLKNQLLDLKIRLNSLLQRVDSYLN